MRIRTTANLKCAPLKIAVVFLVAATSPLATQEPDTVPDAERPVRGSQLLLPLGSVVVPGLGQYVQGAPLQGAGFTATALAGALVARDGITLPVGEFPRNGRDQLTFEADHVAVTAGLLSGWDSFRRSLPALQGEGKYEFVTSQENLGDLLTAPFDFRFLDRWTTWVDLAFTGAVTALVLSERRSDRVYEPFRGNDAAFVTALSLNAAIGEEAMFRGWLLPVLHQTTGGRFWIGNTLQAGAFAGLHVDQAGSFALVHMASALWEGWLTRRNDWSIRESIFHHFWYDVFVATAEFLTDEREAAIHITFPTIRF